ncbi:PBSX phage terminase small subunit [Siminovitchia terrae]|uniref:terminase small subunit n=1 Tax=Siminovitchia terrae TaxID=1914933 RepID=UPI001B1E444D|nr:terminase small subunit [Siminovitchia terrae]GIN93336.1 PBSX phage terminase small subunit [Siminovitchia terrae]
MPNWEDIRKEWETTKITLAALADKHNVKLGTLKSRKSREDWSRDATKKDATIVKRMQPKKEEKEPIVETDNLTDKQRLFCIYYIKYFNATKAYQKAYECAYTTAMTNGNVLLRNTKIISEINRMKKEVTDGLMLDASMVLQKYIDIALADITDFTVFGKKEVEVMTMYGPLEDEDGNVVMKEVNYVDFKESTEIDGTIITEVRQGKDGVSVKLADKMKALEVLAKYTDLIPDHFKRQLEEEKLKIAHVKAFGNDDPEQYEDDGFNEALNAVTSEVWEDVQDTTDEES